MICVDDLQGKLETVISALNLCKNNLKNLYFVNGIDYESFLLLDIKNYWLFEDMIFKILYPELRKNMIEYFKINRDAQVAFRCAMTSIDSRVIAKHISEIYRRMNLDV